MVSPEEFASDVKRWPLAAQVIACVVFSATLSLGFSFVPWNDAWEAFTHTVSLVFNSIFARPVATTWVILTVLISAVCLHMKKIVRIRINLFAIFLSVVVSFFILLMASIFWHEASRQHLKVIEYPGTVADTRSTYIDIDTLRRWKSVQGRDGSQWIATNMSYIECSSFLGQIHGEREYERLNFYVNGKRANYTANLTPRQACSRIMNNHIEQLLVADDDGKLALTASPN